MTTLGIRKDKIVCLTWDWFYPHVYFKAVGKSCLVPRRRYSVGKQGARGSWEGCKSRSCTVCGASIPQRHAHHHVIRKDVWGQSSGKRKLTKKSQICGYLEIRKNSSYIFLLISRKLKECLFRPSRYSKFKNQT